MHRFFAIHALAMSRTQPAIHKVEIRRANRKTPLPPAAQ
jgi:hypothetical protein